MRFGISTFITDQGIAPAALASAVAERGFDSLFVSEHSHIPISRLSPSPEGGELGEKYYRLLDPFIALSAAATVTTRLLLGTGITLLPQRDPIITAKEVASLDLLSGGRFLFGVGVGLNREEMMNHGTDPRTGGRVTEERLEAMQQIWTHDIAEYHSEFVDFGPMSAWPKPIQHPHPPLYIGGGPASFPRIARFAASWFALSVTSLGMSAAVDKLRAVTGMRTAVTVSHIGPVTSRELGGYADHDVERVALYLPTAPEAEPLRRLDDFAALTSRLGR
jgi:probable F420-dependent oxidoreductase